MLTVLMCSCKLPQAMSDPAQGQSFVNEKFSFKNLYLHLSSSVNLKEGTAVI